MRPRRKREMVHSKDHFCQRGEEGVFRAWGGCRAGLGGAEKTTNRQGGVAQAAGNFRGGGARGSWGWDSPKLKKELVLIKGRP